LPNELAERDAREHIYHEFVAFNSLKVVLCDFCDADFGSYYSSYFGLPGSSLVGEVLDLVAEVDPDRQPRRDKVCVACNHRLAFLRFRAAAISLHDTAKSGEHF